MTNFSFSTAEDFRGTCFGTRLLDITTVLALPLPTIKGGQMKKFQKEGLWAVRVFQPGRKSEPPTEDIKFKLIHDDRDKGINIAMQELIGRLCGRHYLELKTHYSHSFGRRDESGEPFEFADGTKETLRPVRQYFQDLETLIRDLDTARTDELLSNDELRAQLKEKDRAFQEQEERIKAMEEKFEEQDKKFKNQERRVQEKNKKIKEMKDELESNDFELDADRDLIERLRAEKRELQEKVDALTVEVKDYKEAFAREGLTFEEEEVDMDED